VLDVRAKVRSGWRTRQSRGPCETRT